MEPSKPGGGAKPSKVEAIKLASQYLMTFVANEVDNGSSHFSEGGTIRLINESLLSTLAACGDVERNVLCCPAPIVEAIRGSMHADAVRWASHCAPRSSSYWEIWLDGEKVESLPPAGDVQVPTPGDD